MLIGLCFCIILILWGLHLSLNRYNRLVVSEPPLKFISWQHQGETLEVIILGEEISVVTDGDLPRQVKEFKNKTTVFCQQRLMEIRAWFVVLREE